MGSSCSHYTRHLDDHLPKPASVAPGHYFRKAFIKFPKPPFVSENLLLSSWDAKPAAVFNTASQAAVPLGSPAKIQQ